MIELYLNLHFCCTLKIFLNKKFSNPLSFMKACKILETRSVHYVKRKGVRELEKMSSGGRGGRTGTLKWIQCVRTPRVPPPKTNTRVWQPFWFLVLIRCNRRKIGCIKRVKRQRLQWIKGKQQIRSCLFDQKLKENPLHAKIIDFEVNTLFM